MIVAKFKFILDETRSELNDIIDFLERYESLGVSMSDLHESFSFELSYHCGLYFYNERPMDKLPTPLDSKEALFFHIDADFNRSPKIDVKIAKEPVDGKISPFGYISVFDIDLSILANAESKEDIIAYFEKSKDCKVQVLDESFWLTKDVFSLSVSFVDISKSLDAFSKISKTLNED